MAGWQRVLTHFANDVENHFDRLKYKLEYRLGGPEPIKIVPYRSFGRPDLFYIKGRVLEDKGELFQQDNQRLWDNLLSMYRRMESDEVPGARLLVRYGEIEQEVTADEEGYFEARIEPRQPIPPGQLWQEVSLRLLSPTSKDQPDPVEAVGQILVPPPTARFAVISDIDDTVVTTDATHLLKMARTVFLGNARTRLPFPGVAAFYRALLNGPYGNDLNPLFYVSSSPWNLYDLLSDFFNLQNIPLGPVLFLRDWGLTENEILPVHNREYKLGVIHRLLDFYPDLPFILIGDSGQEDPEIYEEITENYPDRIMAVYIRNVSHDLKRPEAIKALAEKVLKARSTLILGDDTLTIARHAASKGWIAEAALHGVGVEKEKDQAPPTPLEKVLGQEEKPAGPTVVVQNQTPQKTIDAVKNDAIQEALKTGKEENQKPPTVIIKPKKDKNIKGDPGSTSKPGTSG